MLDKINVSFKNADSTNNLSRFIRDSLKSKPNLSDDEIEHLAESIALNATNPWPFLSFAGEFDKRLFSPRFLFRREGGGSSAIPIGAKLMLLSGTSIPTEFLDFIPRDFLFLYYALDLPMLEDNGILKNEAPTEKWNSGLVSAWRTDERENDGIPERYLHMPISFDVLKKTLDWMETFTSVEPERAVPFFFQTRAVLLRRLLGEFRLRNISNPTMLDACLTAAAAATGVFYTGEGSGVYDSAGCLSRWASLAMLLEKYPFAASLSLVGYVFLVFLKTRSFTAFDDLTALFSKIPWISEKIAPCNDSLSDADKLFLSCMCEPLLEFGYKRISVLAKTISLAEGDGHTPWWKTAFLISGGVPSEPGFWFDENIARNTWNRETLCKAFESPVEFSMSRTERFLRNLHDVGKLDAEQTEFGSLISDSIAGYFDWPAGGRATNAMVHIPPCEHRGVATYFQTVSPFECNDFIETMARIQNTPFGEFFLRAVR